MIIPALDFFVDKISSYGSVYTDILIHYVGWGLCILLSVDFFVLRIFRIFYQFNENTAALFFLLTLVSLLQDVIPLWKEVEYYKEYQQKLKAYLGDRKAKKILSEALYLISLGTNDFMENYYTLPNRRLQFTVKQYQDFIIGLAADFVTTIYSLGARKMSLTGVPPMGCLPLERTTNIMEDHACMEEYNNVGLEFNGKLKGLVAKLNSELPGLDVVFADAYNLLLQLIKRPSVYGKF